MIDIQPYTENFTHSVADFNRRLSAGEPPMRIPESPRPQWLPRVNGTRLFQEMFLAVEDGAVRGGYTLKHQEFSFHGRIECVGFYQNPVSEGIVNKRYVLVGPKLIDHAFKRQPLIYDLGIGSLDAAVARMHRALGWKLSLVPFFFKVLNGFRVLRNLEYLKSRWIHRKILDAAAYSGFGWAGSTLAGLMGSAGPRLGSIDVDVASEFGSWATELWKQCAVHYAMAAVRDASVLNTLYPSGDSKFLRVRVSKHGRDLGWAVLMDSAKSQDKYFGNMRVGSIIDCMARPEDAPVVIAAATRELERRGPDLLISNQNHAAWRRALRRSGFLPGVSNFVFAASPALSDLLHRTDPEGTGIHLTRGDGDGPIHL